MKTDTQTLARAMDILSRDIQSQDGIANAAIREAAERLRELDGKIDADLTRLAHERDEALKDLAFRRELFKVQEAQLNELRGERDEAREALRELWQSADAYLPACDSETIKRWRKAAGWKEAK